MSQHRPQKQPMNNGFHPFNMDGLTSFPPHTPPPVDISHRQVLAAQSQAAYTAGPTFGGRSRPSRQEHIPRRAHSHFPPTYSSCPISAAPPYLMMAPPAAPPGLHFTMNEDHELRALASISPLGPMALPISIAGIIPPPMSLDRERLVATPTGAEATLTTSPVKKPFTEEQRQGALDFVRKHEAHFNYPAVEIAKEERNTGETELLMRRLEQRLKQITFGKDTQGYKSYRRAVPHVWDREYHNELHPVTPRIEYDCSKRSFDRYLNTWRRQLHQWDDYDSMNESFRPLGVATLGNLGLAVPFEEGVEQLKGGVRAQRRVKKPPTLASQAMLQSIAASVGTDVPETMPATTPQLNRGAVVTPMERLGDSAADSSTLLPECSSPYLQFVSYQTGSARAARSSSALGNTPSRSLDGVEIFDPSLLNWQQPPGSRVGSPACLASRNVSRGNTPANLWKTPGRVGAALPNNNGANDGFRGFLQSAELHSGNMKESSAHGCSSSSILQFIPEVLRGGGEVMDDEVTLHDSNNGSAATLHPEEVPSPALTGRQAVDPITQSPNLPPATHHRNHGKPFPNLNGRSPSDGRTTVSDGTMQGSFGPPTSRGFGFPGSAEGQRMYPAASGQLWATASSDVLSPPQSHPMLGHANPISVGIQTSLTQPPVGINNAGMMYFMPITGADGTHSPPTYPKGHNYLRGPHQ